MKEPVLLKGNQFGLTIVLDQAIDFPVLLEEIRKKFTEASGFFNSKQQIAVKIEGRVLSTEEITQMIEVISDCSSLTIAYVIENNQIVETQFKNVIDRSIRLKEEEKRIKPASGGVSFGQFYKGTLRSGQCLESDASVVVVGDVNPGASVIAKGNIVVLGCVKGYVYAGAAENDHAFIAALDMKPVQVRIGQYLARSADETKKEKKKLLKSRRHSKETAEAQIAFVEESNIYIEPISKALLNEITI